MGLHRFVKPIGFIPISSFLYLFPYGNCSIFGKTATHYTWTCGTLL